jgi:folate-binding protein YgfZ
MTDKQDATSVAFSLPGWQVLEVGGADAVAFLQAQTMNDVRSLMPGHWQWNGWLNPKGRVIALFALAALDAQRFWLLLPDMPAAELAARLQRFVFRSKVKLSVREDFGANGEFGGLRCTRGASIHRASDGEVECLTFDMGDQETTRSLFVGTLSDDSEDGAIGRHSVTADDPGPRQWVAFDLAHGLPRLPMEQSELWTPQMLSLDRLNAYSLKKGCYPGQEIVARTHYLGQAKRGLVRIGGSGLPVGAEISAEGRALGNIVSSIGDGALAVLSADRPVAGWECTGSPCRELPLLDGLAR